MMKVSRMMSLMQMAVEVKRRIRIKIKLMTKKISKQIRNMGISPHLKMGYRDFLMQGMVNIIRKVKDGDGGYRMVQFWNGISNMAK